MVSPNQCVAIALMFTMLTAKRKKTFTLRFMSLNARCTCVMLFPMSTAGEDDNKSDDRRGIVLNGSGPWRRCDTCTCAVRHCQCMHTWNRSTSARHSPHRRPHNVHVLWIAIAVKQTPGDYCIKLLPEKNSGYSNPSFSSMVKSMVKLCLPEFFSGSGKSFMQ